MALNKIMFPVYSFWITECVDLPVSFFPMEFGEYADNYCALAENPENTFNRSVDLITYKSLSNPYFIKSLRETKQKIYG